MWNILDSKVYQTVWTRFISIAIFNILKTFFNILKTTNSFHYLHIFLASNVYYYKMAKGSAWLSHGIKVWEFNPGNGSRNSTKFYYLDPILGGCCPYQTLTWNCLMLGLLHFEFGMTSMRMIWMEWALARWRAPMSRSTIRNVNKHLKFLCKPPINVQWDWKFDFRKFFQRPARVMSLWKACCSNTYSLHNFNKNLTLKSTHIQRVIL